MLHIVGTYEKAEEEEGEVYEVVNIKTLKQATPNLRIINLYGITFLDDTHIEAFSSNCIQLQVKDLLNLLKIPILIHISIITASNWIIQKHTCFISGTLCQLLCSRRRWKPQNFVTKMPQSQMFNDATNELKERQRIGGRMG